MKTIPPLPLLRGLALALALALVLTITSTALHAQVPGILNYQGRVAVGSPAVNFEGSGAFKFALVDADGTQTYWSNDGTSTGGSEPTAAVSLPVVKGLYSVLLGDTTLGANMTVIPNSVFTDSDVRLRVWFNDGTNGSQLLTPDQRLAAVGYAMVAGGVPDGTITTEKLAGGLLPKLLSSTSAPEPASAPNAGTVYFNSRDNRLSVSNGLTWRSVANAESVYRWAVWSTYDQAGAGAWFFNNSAALAGGVVPSNWSDAGATASMISADKKVQAALFNKKASISPDSVVWADAWASYSSTNGKLAGALFRVRNTTGAAINWPLNFYGSCYAAWSELASVSLNGANSYSSDAINGNAQTQHSVTLSIPPNRTSTVICVATSGVPSSTTPPMRATVLAFFNGCLTLPAGLEFVDDLDSATGGYEQ